jgi:hypothetical protein
MTDEEERAITIHRNGLPAGYRIINLPDLIDWLQGQMALHQPTNTIPVPTVDTLDGLWVNVTTIDGEPLQPRPDKLVLGAYYDEANKWVTTGQTNSGAEFMRFSDGSLEVTVNSEFESDSYRLPADEVAQLLEFLR